MICGRDVRLAILAPHHALTAAGNIAARDVVSVGVTLFFERPQRDVDRLGRGDIGLTRPIADELAGAVVGLNQDEHRPRQRLAGHDTGEIRVCGHVPPDSDSLLGGGRGGIRLRPEVEIQARHNGISRRRVLPGHDQRVKREDGLVLLRAAGGHCGEGGNEADGQGGRDPTERTLLQADHVSHYMSAQKATQKPCPLWTAAAALRPLPRSEKKTLSPLRLGRGGI